MAIASDAQVLYESEGSVHNGAINPGCEIICPGHSAWSAVIIAQESRVSQN